MSQLDAPDVYLLWESQRFPLRSLTSKCFVVRCESMVRRHAPNTTPTVLNGTLVSDFGDDIPVLFRVSGTDRKMARCQLSPLSVPKIQRIEQLNSTWQAAMMSAAARRAEAASADAARIQAEQVKHETPVAAPLPPAPAPAPAPPRQPATSSTPVTPNHGLPLAETSRQRSGWVRYTIATAIAASIFGLLFFRPGVTSDEQLTQNTLQTDATESKVRPDSPATAQARMTADSSAPASREKTKPDETPPTVAKSNGASAKDTSLLQDADKQIEKTHRNSAEQSKRSTPSQLAQSRQLRSQKPTAMRAKPAATSAPDPSSKNRVFTSRESAERIRRELVNEKKELAQLEDQHDAAVKKQSESVQDAKSTLTQKISEVQKQLSAAKREVDQTESLLEQLAPLIADENIGTAEVQKIKNDLAIAKRLRDTKKRQLKELSKTASFAAESATVNVIDELVAELSRKRAKIQRLETQLLRYPG